MSKPNEIPADGLQRSSRKFAEYLIRKVESGELTAADAMGEYDSYVARKPCPHDNGDQR